MKRLLLALAATCATTFAAVAENRPVVVELFTSQGCSSCPPADEFMEVLAARDDVIALSLHVDYWDYIGWKDEFADPMHTKRQRGYAEYGGRRSIYTPEMIVNGETDIIGAKPMKVATAIEAHKARPSLVDMTVSHTGNQLEVGLQSTGAVSEPLLVHMVHYQPERVSNITRGENAGRTIAYVNVAQDWRVLGSWDGVQPFQKTVQVEQSLPFVVMVQVGSHGPILAASKLP